MRPRPCRPGGNNGGARPPHLSVSKTGALSGRSRLALGGGIALQMEDYGLVRPISFSAFRFRGRAAVWWPEGG